MDGIRDSKARKILVSLDSVIPLLGAYSEKIIVKGEKISVHTKVIMAGKSRGQTSNETTETGNVLLSNNGEIANDIKINGLTKIWRHYVTNGGILNASK